MKSQRTLAALAVLGIALAACGSTDASSNDTLEPMPGTTPYTTDMSVDTRIDSAAEALKNGDFTTMLKMLELSGVAKDIEGHEVTILAPTESAFSDLNADDLENLLTNPTQIDDTLRRHIIDELLTYDELASRMSVTTMSGDTLDVAMVDGELTVGGAVVSKPAADAVSGENGQEVAVFGIDRVLVDTP